MCVENKNANALASMQCSRGVAVRCYGKDPASEGRASGGLPKRSAGRSAAGARPLQARRRSHARVECISKTAPFDIMRPRCALQQPRLWLRSVVVKLASERIMIEKGRCF